MKTRVPCPDGPRGIVYLIAREQTGALSLDVLAFGVRHHPKESHALTVYQIAHDRLHEITAKDLRGKDPDTPSPRTEN